MALVLRANWSAHSSLRPEYPSPLSRLGALVFASVGQLFTGETVAIRMNLDGD